MEVTFLIGNGFDLRLGLHTRFTDVYNQYILQESPNKNIEKFKEELKTDAPEYKKWSDFEMGMANHAKSFENADDFIECIHDFRDFMQFYLNDQNKKWFDLLESVSNSGALLSKELYNSILKFHIAPSRNIINYINDRSRKTNGINANFITFNYTNTIDRIINEYNSRNQQSLFKANPSIHIHGSLNTDVLIGVDNEEQLKTAGFSITKRVKRAFLKPYLNSEYDWQRVEQAKTYITYADAICVYGLSFGESDLTWKLEIIEWLKTDNSHHLFYYRHNDLEMKNWQVDDKLNQEDDFRIELLERLGCTESEMDELSDQVHIPIGHNIFNFKRIIEKDGKKHVERPRENGLG